MGVCGSTCADEGPLPVDAVGVDSADSNAGKAEANAEQGTVKEPTYTPTDAELFSAPKPANSVSAADDASARAPSPWFNRSQSPFKRRNRDAEAAASSPRSQKNYEDELKARDTKIEIMHQIIANHEKELISSQTSQTSNSEPPKFTETVTNAPIAKRTAERTAALAAIRTTLATPNSPVTSPTAHSPMGTPADRRSNPTNTPAEVAAEFFNLINDAKRPLGFETTEQYSKKELDDFLDHHPTEKKHAKSMYASTYSLLDDDAHLDEVVPKMSGDDQKTSTVSAAAIVKGKALKRIHKVFYSEPVDIGEGKFNCKGCYVERRAKTNHDTTIEIVDLKIRVITDVRALGK